MLFLCIFVMNVLFIVAKLLSYIFRNVYYFTITK